MNTATKTKPVILILERDSTAEMVGANLHHKLGDCDILVANTQDHVTGFLEQQQAAGRPVDIMLADRHHDAEAKGFPAEVLHKAKQWAQKRGQKLPTILYQLQGDHHPATSPLGVDKIVSIGGDVDALATAVQKSLANGQAR